MMRLNRKGFTLVELMIVVAIISLLVAIAIPNLLRTRISANEAAAIANVRTLSTACESYRAQQTPPTYAAALTDLSGATPPYIDSALGSGTRQGYTYTYAGTADAYTCTAAPVTPNVTGVRTFFVDQEGVIRLDDASGAPIE
ncbi:MAG: prepilin-type N-terminal cleavage/methylation domain-containing protein [Candidatus Omnitrophota bacterium]